MTRYVRSRSVRGLATGVAVLALLFAGCADRPAAVAAAGHAPGGRSVQPVSVSRLQPPPPTTGKRRNIVLVLTDDLSTNLVRYMPHVQAMMQQGMTFTNYTVTNSLCCPSRASIFTGEFPHNTGVQTNVAPNGGYAGFEKHGDESHTWAVSLANAGYRTGFFGKYLNGYHATLAPANPPGWTMWDGTDEGYGGYNYHLANNGNPVYYGSRPRDYLTTVLDRLGRRFIGSSAAAGQPFALEVATTSPHDPYVPAPVDRGTFQGLGVPRTPAYNTHPSNAPKWLASMPPLTQTQLDRGDRVFMKRVECVQSVDRLVGHLEHKLRAVHELGRTVFIFSSDNGLHVDDYGLGAGKLTAFDTDVNVPLVVTGPGIAAGSVNSLPVENIDLAPTFDDLAETPIPADVDGHTIVPLLYGQDVPWRTLADIEHVYTPSVKGDPDAQPYSAGHLPPYRALRSASFTYVEYAKGEREYYDRSTDPYELDNIYDTISQQTKDALHAQVLALTTCSGYEQCWAAAQPTG